MWRSAFLKLGQALTLSCAIVPDISSAAIFDRDDREYVSTAPGSAYSPIGLVRRSNLTGSYTTGTIVSDCHVLTSQHIFGSRTNPLGQRLTFIAGFGSANQISSRGTVIAAGGYENHRAAYDRSAAVAADWILVRLDLCLGLTLGHAKLRSSVSSSFELRRVQSAGYPADRNRRAGLVVDPSCEVRRIYALVWLNDCATLHGNSGGPIFRLGSETSKPTLEVFAIQSAGIMRKQTVHYERGLDNWATPVAMVIPHIHQFLEAR